jgi:hypothetical protein
MTLSSKENYLRALRHENPEYIPHGWVESGIYGHPFELDNGPPGGGYDGFGIRWISSVSGGGAGLPDSSTFQLEDVTKWKKTITFPNVDAVNWKAIAEENLARVNRDTQAFVALSSVGPFERLASFMGFEGALIAMVTEPDAVNELFAAITDYKVKLVEKYAQYFKPDVFAFFDDIATERSLFMSPATYRQLIKPHHKRIVDAIKNCGIIPIQHTCGCAEAIIEDMIEIGAAAWNSVQIRNDIAGILNKYGNKICIEGGYDSNGPASFENASDAEIEAEVRRCFTEYGKYKGYLFFGSLLIGQADPMKVLDGLLRVHNAYLKVRDGK